MNIFEKPTFEVIKFSASDIIVETSGCLVDLMPGGNGGDSDIEYGAPEYE